MSGRGIILARSEQQSMFPYLYNTASPVDWQQSKDSSLVLMNLSSCPPVLGSSVIALAVLCGGVMDPEEVLYLKCNLLMSLELRLSPSAAILCPSST